MSLLALAAALVGSLLLVPVGLPGTWLMVGCALVYDWLVPAAPIGWTYTGIAIGLTVLAEVLEFTLSARYTKKYGGSQRAGWGAILGGMAGAIMGVPVPLIGSVIGAFVGAFVGALLMELTRKESTRGSATRVAWGAFLGRVAAAMAKTGLACAIAALLLVGAWR
ncbi:MAG: DUF456 domain-containing protein [Gemmatimonadaceae bacterium]